MQPKDRSKSEAAVLDDELTSEERAELHASLDRACVQSEEGLGLGVDAWEYLARYKRVPESHLEELDRRADAADRDGGKGDDWPIVRARLRRE